MMTQSNSNLGGAKVASPNLGHGGEGLLPPLPLDDGSGRPAGWRAVYTIVERGSRKHWLRIGVAFVNRDSSLNVRLDAVPVNGQLHIRDAPPRDGRDGRDGVMPPGADLFPSERGEGRPAWRES